jgi:hypothetical protein
VKFLTKDQNVVFKSKRKSECEKRWQTTRSISESEINEKITKIDDDDKKEEEEVKGWEDKNK